MSGAIGLADPSGTSGESRGAGPAPRRAPTLEEVAELAGVSRATVSRVVNGSSRVSPEALASVTAAIAQLGYVPNRAARSLVTRRTDTLVLIVHERPDTVFSDPFFASVLRGVNRALSPTDLQLVLLQAQGEAQRDRALRYVGNGHVDGVLLISLHGDDIMPNAIAAAGVPLVMAGRLLTGRMVDYVDADNVGGARDAVGHLLATGRRRIATVAGPPDMSVGVDRLRGYTEAVRAAGGDAAAGWVVVGDFTEASGQAATERLLAEHPDLDAVFAASDLMALGALRALRAAGRRVPDDVAVVGFDDAALAAYADPPLTTVRQQVELMGQEMVQLLLARIADPDGEPRELILPTELVIRASA
ncbi:MULTISPECIES: LacI family DNA-binding transcriptional regulator [unclassified Frankia]|uniref:LacI family DNA-binding transcriptional regulator n=1 Tax=unclassified Frankia TaxID=2632575 RepID=UPI001EE4DF12|nr:MULTISPECIES: LacI family DNA-binding transcriptional regulator [unclassified Frankia]